MSPHDAYWARVYARRTDPQTSWDAARSVRNLTGRQVAVYQLLRQYPDGLTDWEISRLYPADWPKQSESGLRTRRSELVDRFLVADSGVRRRLPSGRAAVVWKVTP